MIRAAMSALLLLAVAACGTTPTQPPGAAVQALFAEYWNENLQLDPLGATFVGDHRYDDQLPNTFSAEHRARRHAFRTRWLTRIEAVDTGPLGDQDRLSVEILKRDLREDLEGERFPSHLLAINQFYSLPSTLAQLGSGTSAQPFATTADYDRWLARVAQVPTVFDQIIANMREGMSQGVVLPRALVIKMIPQFDAQVVEDPTASLFYGPIRRLPGDMDPADQERLSAAYAAAIRDQIVPSYRRLRDFLRDDYLPKARSSAGLAALPDGEAWYAHLARSVTTTDLTPAQIHQIGLDEVARIHAEMHKVMKAVGYKKGLKAFFKFLATDSRFQFASEKDLLRRYNDLRQTVDAEIPRLFSVTPRAGFEIRPIEAFRAASAAGGEYQPPSEDGTRPGIFYVNTHDMPSRKIWDMEDLYLHEAIPGHHFQIAIQQELKGVPAFRRFGGTTAYIEGWALYAESLGKELGVYQDPYMYFGYLQNELWRAIRLVVDTGLHSKGWTREQVIAYMLENSAESETQSVAEAERYMAIPGQALGYKIGELKIKELRARAQAALGNRFDVRGFHAEVLRDGGVPLSVLEGKIDRWIAAQPAR